MSGLKSAAASDGRNRFAEDFGLVKRLHDRNHSAHYLWAFLIPIVGPIWILVEVWFLKGTTGPNRYGADPLGL